MCRTSRRCSSRVLSPRGGSRKEALPLQSQVSVGTVWKQMCRTSRGCSSRVISPRGESRKEALPLQSLISAGRVWKVII
ncbi:hypothetical protein CDAR_198691 [Caerostris darwini]|uniref:Uncharacterized protein n=1 Tax=Caerostris darwini TaxID=1538125 RepID=A0AAV4W3H0_9ARAC|nr:hypothetical protein CDAR_198691 [Caerostris darwini]